MQTPFSNTVSERLQQLVLHHTEDTQGLLLRLAWQAGLERNEIENLSWNEVLSTELHLPDRVIPLEGDLPDFLDKWRLFCAPLQTPYVTISHRSKKHMVGPAISQMIRRLLNSVDLTDLTLLDLRHDYILRQLETREWYEALRITGLPVSSYLRNQDLRTAIATSPTRESPPPSTAQQVLDTKSEQVLVQLIEAEKTTIPGLALWMVYYTDIEVQEMVALTWDQVDLQSGILHLPRSSSTGSDELPISPELAQIFQTIQAERTPADDPHVFLTERSRKPMDQSWLLTRVRTLLVRAGLGAITMRNIQNHVLRRQLQDKIMARVDHKGCTTTQEIVDTLGISSSTAHYHLSKMVSNGLLVRVNNRYYTPQNAITEHNRKYKLLAYLREHGPARSATMAEYMHIGKRLAAKVLREMVDEGMIGHSFVTGEFFYIEPAVSDRPIGPHVDISRPWSRCTLTNTASLPPPM